MERSRKVFVSHRSSTLPATLIDRWNVYVHRVLELACMASSRHQFLRLRPISVGLQQFVSEAGAEINLQMAGAVIATIPALIVYFFNPERIYRRYINVGIERVILMSQLFLLLSGFVVFGCGKPSSDFSEPQVVDLEQIDPRGQEASALVSAHSGKRTRT